MLEDVRWAGLASAHWGFLTSPHRALTRAQISGTLPSSLHSWSPTNNLTAMLKAVVLPSSYPIPCILFLFMQQEFGEILPSAAPWVIHATQERSKENKHLILEENLSSSLELLLHKLRQVHLQPWVPKITFRKTQLKAQEKWVWITDIPWEPGGNISVT